MKVTTIKTTKPIEDPIKTEASIETFNFEDGNGPVLAHRHRNPDGTTGGWVANEIEKEIKQ